LIQTYALKFYSREELNKKFLLINRKLKEFLNEGRGNSNDREDAMLSKKHLGPMACASCEQNLINMQGIGAEYHNWKKMPARETSERIARYGQGFSKILSTLREDISNSNMTSVMQNHIHEKKSLHQRKRTLLN
jgi:hypothetical protein